MADDANSQRGAYSYSYSFVAEGGRRDSLRLNLGCLLFLLLSLFPISYPLDYPNPRFLHARQTSSTFSRERARRRGRGRLVVLHSLNADDKINEGLPTQDAR